MELNIQEELMLFFHAMLAGAFLLAVYDVLRIFRRVVPHSGFFVAVEDLLYWLFDALFLFYMMYRENSGTMRGYVILGTLLGMLAYNRTVSGYLVNLLSGILNRMIGIFRAVLRLLLRPFAFLWRHTAGKIAKFVRKLYEISKKRLKKVSKHITMKLHMIRKYEAGREDDEEEKETE